MTPSSGVKAIVASPKSSSAARWESRPSPRNRRPKVTVAAARLDVANRGIHEGGGEPVARDQRMIAAPARRERLADHARREHCGTFWSVDVERGREEGFDQALIERSRARNRFLDRRAAPRPQQSREREIFGKARAGRAALSVENPPGDRARRWLARSNARLSSDRRREKKPTMTTRDDRAPR